MPLERLPVLFRLPVDRLREPRFGVVFRVSVLRFAVLLRLVVVVRFAAVFRVPVLRFAVLLRLVVVARFAAVFRVPVLRFAVLFRFAAVPRFPADFRFVVLRFLAERLDPDRALDDLREVAI